MRVMRAWHICPKWEMAFGAAAKCGSTMLANWVAANGAHRLNVPDARHGRECWSIIPEDYERVAIVRHPVDRFASLYANVQQRKRSDQNFYKQLEGKSPWDFFDRLLELSNDLLYDFHFQPQALCLGPHVDTAIRLESFAEWVNSCMPDVRRPKQVNESKPVEIDDKTAARVLNRYRDDLALWEGAWHA